MSNLVIALLLIVLIVILFYYFNPYRLEQAEEPPKEEKTKEITEKAAQDEGDVSVLSTLPKEQVDLLLKYGSPEDLAWAARPVKFDDMTKAEKIDYIINKYFQKPKPTEVTPAATTVINEIVRSNQGCEDKYKDCETWAKNDECQINPEYMLYNCEKSCHVCGVSPDDKYKLTKAYSEQPIGNCVYHGENYPGEGYLLHTFYDYTSY